MSTTTTSKPATRAARAAGTADHANRSAGRSAAMTIVVTGLLVIVALEVTESEGRWAARAKRPSQAQGRRGA